MAVNSRRKAREAVLRALYEVEVGHAPPEVAAAAASLEFDLTDDLTAYALRVVTGIQQNLDDIDNRLAKLIRDYDFDRIAAIDRNVLRLATFELLHEDTIPPAVTINEAVAIVKRYSTADSGGFVNGVLAKLLKDTPKADWTASSDIYEPSLTEHEEEPVEEVVEENSEEAITARKFGSWTVKGGK